MIEPVHRAVHPGHDPCTELIPPQGIKLTPRHYAYLKISEGCNNRCTFCIITRRARGRDRGISLGPAILPSAGRIFEIGPIGGRILRNDDQLFHAGCNELFRFAQDVAGGRGDQIERKIGGREKVIIDEVGSGGAKGRSKGDALQIDGTVHVRSHRPLRIGEIATVKIERADAYDLHGSVVGC